MNKEIWLDMDGTFVDLYGVENWLDYLINQDPLPYREARPLINLSLFARLLNKAQRNGYTINIVSWLAKDATCAYDEQVAAAKEVWLKKHLPSVEFDRIEILEYGTPKSQVSNGGYLFDDEEKNRVEWNGISYSNVEMIKVLKGICCAA